jgi:hypothetical protein
VVPGGFDGAVGYAQRLHKLHIEIRRELKAGVEIDLESRGTVVVVSPCLRRHRRGGADGADKRFDRVATSDWATHKV